MTNEATRPLTIPTEAAEYIDSRLLPIVNLFVGRQQEIAALFVDAMRTAYLQGLHDAVGMMRSDQQALLDQILSALQSPHAPTAQKH